MKPEHASKPPLPIKEAAPLHKPPLVKPETTAKAFDIAAQAAEGQVPNSNDISMMVKSLAADLKAQGVAVSSEDIREVERLIKEGHLVPVVYADMKPEITPPVRLKDLPDIDLKEYQKVMDGFERNYGLDKGAWNTISGILISTDAAGQALNGFYRKTFQTGEGWAKLSKTFKDKISHDTLHLHEKSWDQFKQDIKSMTWAERGSISKKIGVLAWKAAAPLILSPVYWFADKHAIKMAGRMFMTERTRLQEQVNNRIADSLYMRNFEFIHDQSAAEMLQVINNGKDATVGLVSAVYEELIPLRWSQATSVLSQGIVNKWDMAAAAFKGFLMDTRTMPNARRIQVQRKDELAQWDKVNTKLLSTLQGLETIRTAGNAEVASDVLYQSLAERDFVEAGGLREKRMQDKEINKLFDVLDVAVPIVTEAKSWRDLKKAGRLQFEKPDGTIEDRELNAEDMFVHIINGYFRVTGSKAEQQMLRQSFLQLTHLYVDKIIPYIEDVRRMEELLGPYDELDHPMGLRERARIQASQVKNFDISVKDLRFKDILHGVSLDIPQGVFVTIKGPSGIGKSTLFRHLVGLYEGDSGSVQYGGVGIDGIKKYGPESLYTQIAYANQNPQYFEDMTLRENLLLWTPKQVPDEKIESVLKDLRLDQLLDRLDTKSKHFSGGEMRRIGIARALLKDPKVLFLDEPTANLDAISSQQVMNIIQELRKKRPDMTVVAITHDPVFEKIAERIVDFEQLNRKPSAPDLKDNQVFEAKAKA